jgi:hypothetical protein
LTILLPLNSGEHVGDDEHATVAARHPGDVPSTGSERGASRGSIAMWGTSHISDAVYVLVLLVAFGLVVWLVVEVVIFADKGEFDWRLKPVLVGVAVVVGLVVITGIAYKHQRDRQQQRHDLRRTDCVNRIIETQNRQALPGECP